MLARSCSVLALCTSLAPMEALASCSEPYLIDTLLNDLIETERHLRQGEDAAPAARRLESGLSCLDKLVPKMILGRVFRAIGAGLAASGELDRGTRWLRTAAELEPAFVYGLEDLPSEHIVRDLYALAGESSEETLTVGFRLVDPVFLDGKLIETPVARPHRYHLLQQQDDEGQIRSWVLTDDVFPLDVLEPWIPEADRHKPEDTQNDLVVISCPGPGYRREKRVLLASGVTLLSGSALLYGASIPARHAFFEAKDFDELQRQQLTVNRLTGASIVAGVVGSSLLAWGFAF